MAGEFDRWEGVLLLQAERGRCCGWAVDSELRLVTLQDKGTPKAQGHVRLLSAKDS